jgi:methionyl aminopeptidase
MIAKTEAQRNTLREGGRRLASVLHELGDMVAPGVTTQDLEDRARELIDVLGDKAATLGYTPAGSSRPFPAALCTSINDNIVHGIPNENPRTLRDGDIISIDCLLEHNGLIVDSAITVGVGMVDREDRRLMSAVREALSEAIKVARVGNTLGDIGHAVESTARKYDYDLPKELGGHGVGFSVHEQPFVANYGRLGKGERLVDGMVLAIEPMFVRGKADIQLMPDGYSYTVRDGSNTAHFEHTVLITNNDTEVLTR